MPGGYCRQELALGLSLKRMMLSISVLLHAGEQHLHIFTRIFLGALVAKTNAWVVSAKNLCLHWFIFVAIKLTTKTAYVFLVIEEISGGDVSKANNIAGIDDSELKLEKGQAVLALYVGGDAVVWRPALD